MSHIKCSPGKPGSAVESVINLKYDIKSSGGYKFIFSQCLLLFRSSESKAVIIDIFIHLGSGLQDVRDGRVCSGSAVRPSKLWVMLSRNAPLSRVGMEALLARPKVAL